MKSNGTSRVELNGAGPVNGFVVSGRKPNGYYYSSGAPSQVLGSTRSLNQPPAPVHHSHSAASSPGQPVTQTFRTVTTTKIDPPHRSGTLPAGSSAAAAGRRELAPPPPDMEPPTYMVEHLASFAVGPEFGLVTAADGIRKLKEMEQKSAICAQLMFMKLFPDKISVVNEDNDLVENFNMDQVTEPTAHQSNDPHDMYNNVLLFVVKEDTRNARLPTLPTEMHIFQCAKVSADEVAGDIHLYTRKLFHKVKPGKRNFAGIPPPAPSSYYEGHPGRRDFGEEQTAPQTGFDFYEMDVSAAMAQRELEQHYKFRSGMRKNRAHEAALAAQHGILQMKAQLPSYSEFYDVFQKFKLSFNLLAKLKNHIRDPNAPELLHHLFTPLTVILDACQWGLRRNIAQEVVSPLLTYEACELLRNCLMSKEQEVWMALGKAWRTPPGEWNGPIIPAYRPVFYSAPHFPVPIDPPQPRYGTMPGAIHRGASAPPPQQHYPPPQPFRGASHRDRSLDNLEIEKVNLEKDRLEFEKMRVREREARLQEEERRLKQEQARLEAERRLLHKEAERQSIAGTDRVDYYHREDSANSPTHVFHASQVNGQNGHGHIGSNGTSQPRPNIPIHIQDQSPRQTAYLDNLIMRRAKAAQVTYDRVAQNPKELTVARGEYLEVLNDVKNWWECKNASGRVGYVPHTILALITVDEELVCGPPN